MFTGRGRRGENYLIKGLWVNLDIMSFNMKVTYETALPVYHKAFKYNWAAASLNCNWHGGIQKMIGELRFNKLCDQEKETLRQVQATYSLPNREKWRKARYLSEY